MGNRNNTIRPLEKALADFPVETVKKTATDFNKNFHAKIFTLVAASESELHAFSKRLSPHYRYCFAFMQGDEGQWFLDWEGAGVVREWIVGEIERHGSRAIFDIHTAWKEDWAYYMSVRREIDSLDLRRFSDAAFFEWFEEFHVGYLRAGSVAYMADTFMSTGESDWLEETLGKELAGKVPDNEIPETVRVLTNPLFQSYTLESEWRLVEIGVEMETLYGKNFPPLSSLRGSALYESLENHSRSFYWIHNNYFNVEVLDTAHFYGELRKKRAELARLGSAFKEICQARGKEEALLKEERDTLVRRLNLSYFGRELLKVAWLFAEWKDMRKSGSYIGMHYYDIFLEALSKRVPYSKQELSFLIFQEIKALIFEKKDFHKVIAMRREKAFFAVTPEGYYIIEGRDADRYFAEAGGETVATAELKGVVACRGFVTGKVRVIRKTEDMRSFEKGEILVTNQTTPEFVPIMKKAVAIITEQGGITSHAAVISRELNIPCIIGIKIATRALKDGDVVEVDANSGIVKIIKGHDEKV